MQSVEVTSPDRLPSLYRRWLTAYQELLRGERDRPWNVLFQAPQGIGKTRQAHKFMSEPGRADTYHFRVYAPRHDLIREQFETARMYAQERFGPERVVEDAELPDSVFHCKHEDGSHAYTVRVIRGRNQHDGEGRPFCAWAEEFDLLTKLGANVSENLCKKEWCGCKGCLYPRQATPAPQPGITLLPHNYLDMHMTDEPLVLPPADLVFIDECFTSALVQPRSDGEGGGGRVRDVPLDTLFNHRPDWDPEIEYILERQNLSSGQVQRAIMKNDPEELYPSAEEAAADPSLLDVKPEQAFKEIAGLFRDTLNDYRQNAPLWKADIRHEGQFRRKLQEDNRLENKRMFWEQLGEEVKHSGAQFLMLWMKDSRNVSIARPGRIKCLSDNRDTPATEALGGMVGDKRLVPVMILDGTGDPDIYNRFVRLDHTETMPHDRKVVTFQASDVTIPKNHHAVAKDLTPHAELQPRQGQRQPRERQRADGSTAVVQERPYEERFYEFWDAVRRLMMLERYNGREPCVVTHKQGHDLLEAFYPDLCRDDAYSNDPEYIDPQRGYAPRVFHFGDLVGRDDLKRFGSMIIVGRQERGPQDLEEEARLLWGRRWQGDDETAEPLQLLGPDVDHNAVKEYRAKPFEGATTEITYLGYDAKVDRLLQFYRESGLEQTADRLRLIHRDSKGQPEPFRTGAQPKRLYVLTAVPVGRPDDPGYIKPDYVRPYRTILPMPGSIRADLAETGFADLSKHKKRFNNKQRCMNEVWPLLRDYRQTLVRCRVGKKRGPSGLGVIVDDHPMLEQTLREKDVEIISEEKWEESYEPQDQ
jgi:hypothetical protein